MRDDRFTHPKAQTSIQSQQLPMELDTASIHQGIVDQTPDHGPMKSEGPASIRVFVMKHWTHSGLEGSWEMTRCVRPTPLPPRQVPLDNIDLVLPKAASLPDQAVKGGSMNYKKDGPKWCLQLSNLEPDPSGDNNGNNGVSSSSNNHSHGAPHVEDLEPAHARKPIEPEAITPAWAVLSKVAFLVYISLMMAYLFLSGQGPGEDRGRINTARLIVLVLWMVNSGVLFLCHGQYLTRHKREIASAFFISAVGLHYLVGAGEAALADTIGVVMVCIVIATLCPGLLRLWLWPLGMASSP